MYLQIRNTSDKDMSDLQVKVAKAVQEKDETVTTSPYSAHYWIQANVQKADKMDLHTARGFLTQGHEGAVLGCVSCRYYCI